jgi:hypothetical protein
MSATLLLAARRGFGVAAIPASVEIVGAASVAVGATTQLSAVVKDARGNVLAGQSVVWSVGNSPQATVDATGLVTGQAAGACVIQAAAGDAVGSLDFTVTPGVDTTAPAVPTGLAVGTVTNLTIPLTWNLHPNTDGDLSRFRAYSTDDGTTPTMSGLWLLVATRATATGGTFTAPNASTSYKLALAAVDTIGNISPLSNVVTAMSGTAPVTNEPVGLTTMFHSQGTKITTGADGSAAHFVGLKFDDARYVEQVADAEAPYGTAVEWRWWNADLDGNGTPDDGAGANGFVQFTTNPALGAPASEVYYRLVIKHNVDWVHEPGGDKLMYFGAEIGVASGFFLMLSDSVANSSPQPGRRSPYRVGYQGQNQVPVSDRGDDWFWWIGGASFTPINVGVYHTYEVYMKQESAPGAGDGVFKAWIDGALRTNDLAVNWVKATGTSGYSGWQWEPYWGGSGNNKSEGGLAAGDFDWLRYGELYISGKV